MLDERSQKQIYALSQKCIAMNEYAGQKLSSLRDTVFKSGIPVKLIQMKIDERQQRFAKFYAKLNVRFDQYKQLTFDYDALCFVPDRNERIMSRLNIVRTNLYKKYDEMKRVALNMAYINKINELLLPFESDQQGNIIEATVLKELLAWGAIVLKDATWNTFSEDALNQLIFDMDTNFKPPDMVLQKTDNSGYFKENEFKMLKEDNDIIEKIRTVNSEQEAYGFPPLGVERGAESYYGFNTKMSSYSLRQNISFHEISNRINKFEVFVTSVLEFQFSKTGNSATTESNKNDV